MLGKISKVYLTYTEEELEARRSVATPVYTSKAAVVYCK